MKTKIDGGGLSRIKSGKFLRKLYMRELLYTDYRLLGISFK